MDNSSTYSSLLNSYLYESQSSLAQTLKDQNFPIPEINIDRSDSTDSFDFSSSRIPESQSLPISNNLQSLPVSNDSRRNSVVSSVNSVYTSSIFSKDHDIEDSKEHIKTKEKSKNIFKRFPHNENRVFPRDEDEEYYRYIGKYLDANVYNYSTSQILHLNWNEIFEIYLFGNLINNIFTENNYKIPISVNIDDISQEKKQNDHLMDYLFHDTFEKGHLIFHLENFQVKYISVESIVLNFDTLLKNLEYFEEILALYADEQNYESHKLFDVFQDFVLRINFPIPLALAMFGNFLLSFGSSSFDYQKEELMAYFRRSARLAWILKVLNDHKYFDQALEKFSPSDQQRLRQFLTKDNKLALSISLYNLGEFYQSHNDCNTAINIWELNAQLTSDSESCNMAIWGLSDGHGGGNKVKMLNKLGRKSKTNKHNTKRRIAQLYRLQNSQTVGISWIWKSKYD